ncbi:hypothetical protein SAMN05216559_1505 [Halomicrobium zhouii]|uniref:DUF7847 domain-containing protein n=1 Tax=Halomicrobium zhouii TaxID=767519 RepID=A0A1I6KSZ7_9EURY|nr:hypothetical protein [Halomicrobium zhouii]SFR94349.1 hypothetical protein SAMN05216559_1505 [Halomicrobium zhouii]
MGVIGSLSTGVGSLKRNPVIWILVFAYSLAGAGLSALQVIDPWLVLAGSAVFLFAVPFYLGGIIGTLEEGLHGRATVGRFFSAGTSNYLSIFGGTIVLGIVTFVLYFVVGFVGLILSIFVLGFGSMADVTSAAVAVLLVGVLLSLLVVLLPWFFLQFFPAAVVVDDLGLVDSFKRSGSLVKNNFLSVVGFDLLAFLISLVSYIPTVYMLALSADDPRSLENAGQTALHALSTTELGIYLAMTVVLGTIVYAVSHAFYVAYYDQLPR